MMGKPDYIWCCGHACVIGIERNELRSYISMWNNHIRFFWVGDFWEYLSDEIEQTVTGLDIIWNSKKKVNTASLPIIKEAIRRDSE